MAPPPVASTSYLEQENAIDQIAALVTSVVERHAEIDKEVYDQVTELATIPRTFARILSDIDLAASASNDVAVQGLKARADKIIADAAAITEKLRLRKDAMVANLI